MEASAVLELYNTLTHNGISIWIDGGWGVDALLGEQTRDHEDVDIVMQDKDVPKLRKILQEQNYKDIKRDDTSAWNFVLGDDKGHTVDVHVFTFDVDGNGIYGSRGAIFPAVSLTGSGMINGESVQCISPEYVVKFHTGYKLDENDIKDVTALCKRFGIDLPEEYRNIF